MWVNSEWWFGHLPLFFKAAPAMCPQCAFNIVYWVLASLMFSDLRWIKYKSVGTDQGLRALYLRWEFFNAVKKLDLQFSLILLATGFIFFNGSQLELVLLGVNICLLFLEIGWAMLGKAAIRQGSTCFGVLFIALSLPYIAYVFAITALALDSSVDAFNAAKSLKAEAEVLGLLMCGVFNRLCTVGCMISMMLAFHTKSFADLKLFFKQKKTKFIPLGLRPPPVPICGCDRSRCLAVCGRRCAICCCGRDVSAAGWSTEGQDMTGTEMALFRGPGAAGAIGGAAPASTAGRGDEAGGLGGSEEEDEATRRIQRDSFTVAYLAAREDAKRVDLEPAESRTGSETEESLAIPAAATPRVSFTDVAAAAEAAAAGTAPARVEDSFGSSATAGARQWGDSGTLGPPPSADHSREGPAKPDGDRRRERLDARRAKRLEQQGGV